MLKAILIDDEPKGRNLLQQLLQPIPQIDVVAVAGNAEEGLKKIDQYRPDVVFLDIEMPGQSGFDLLRECRNIDFKIVFVSAHNHYSLKAIKFHAFDYLLKPVDIDELHQTIQKLIQSTRLPDQQIMESLLQTPYNKSFTRIAIASLNSIELIDHDQIIYFEARGNATCVHLANQSTLIASKTLKDFETLLSDHFFYRIHHSYLINLQHVTKYIKGEGGSVLLRVQVELEVSRRKKNGFLETLSRFTAR